MRWKGGRRSTNVEDRRGSASVGARASAGAPILMRLLPMLLRTRGGRYALGLGVAGLFLASQFGVDVGALLGAGGSKPVASQKPNPAQQELADFVSVVLADTEDTWQALFQAGGQQYKVPRLVLFSGAVRSACGSADAAMGPFYCPADQKVYIDLSFYDDLRSRHGAPGDFAQAYVIAHEVGHHVQNLLGTSGKVQQARSRVSEAEGNQLSVKLELQADCYAGLWGYHANRTRGLVEQGDLEEALTAAAAIGDDRLQEKSRGRVSPESFTHGTSEQRVYWFRQGYQSGRVDSCDTFARAQNG